MPVVIEQGLPTVEESLATGLRDYAERIEGWHADAEKARVGHRKLDSHTRKWLADAPDPATVCLLAAQLDDGKIRVAEDDESMRLYAEITVTLDVTLVDEHGETVQTVNVESDVAETYSLLEGIGREDIIGQYPRVGDVGGAMTFASRMKSSL